MYLRAILLLTIMLTFIVAPDLALAQSNLFEPSEGDKSIVILKSIFGGIFDGGADPMMAGIAAFNAGVLTIGGVLVSYTILIGTIGTAHDGEMLGKKFSSAWVPIRTAAGTALVLPIIGGGYCIMQALVAWLITQGIGLADKVWDSYASTEGLKSLSSAGLQSITTKPFGYGVYQSQFCVASINKAYEKATTEQKLAIGENLRAEAKTFNKPTALSGTSDEIKFGVFASENAVASDANCGTASIPKSPAPLDYANSSTGAVSTIGSLAMAGITGGNNAAQVRAKKITEAQYNAAKELVSEMKTLAEAAVASETPTSPSEINKVIVKYENAVTKASAEVIASMKEFETLSSSATKDGWFLAGAFYTKIAFMTDMVNRSMSATGSATGPSVVTKSTLKDLLIPYSNVLKESMANNPAAGISNSFGIEDENGTSKSWADALKDIGSLNFDTVMKKIFVGTAKFVVDDGEHPLMAMKRLGNTLISMVTAATAVVLVAVAGIGALSDAAANILILATTGIVAPIIMVGIVLSYLLPMLPFFLWFGAVIGWVVMCVEAILAAPMWAVMHLSPHGDDLVGTGSQGYKLVLSLMLRPVLMIFGLIVALVMLNVIGGLFTKIFFDVFVINQQDTSFIPWILSIIVAPLMYSIAMYILIKKLFSMIHVIPDEMLKWFGGGGPQLGNFANTIGGEQGGMATAAAVIGTQASQQFSNTAGKLKEKLQNNDKERDAVNKFKNETPKLGDVVSKGGNGKTLGTHEQFQRQSNMSSDMEDLGGSDSDMGIAYASSMSQLSDGDYKGTFDQMRSEAKAAAIDKVYGEGSASTISKITGGKFSGHKFNNTMNQVKNAATTLSKAGMSSPEANAKIGEAFANVESTLKKMPTSDERADTRNILLASLSNISVGGGKTLGDVSEEMKDEPKDPN